MKELKIMDFYQQQDILIKSPNLENLLKCVDLIGGDYEMDKSLDTYREAATKMFSHGIDAVEVSDILHDLWWASASEFGA